MSERDPKLRLVLRSCHPYTKCSCGRPRHLAWLKNGRELTQHEPPESCLHTPTRPRHSRKSQLLALLPEQLLLAREGRHSLDSHRFHWIDKHRTRQPHVPLRGAV